MKTRASKPGYVVEQNFGGTWGRIPEVFSTLKIAETAKRQREARWGGEYRIVSEE